MKRVITHHYFKGYKKLPVMRTTIYEVLSPDNDIYTKRGYILYDYYGVGKALGLDNKRYIGYV